MAHLPSEIANVTVHKKKESRRETMLHQPILDKLSSSNLSGKLSRLWEQIESSQYQKLSFEERFGLLLDWEWSLRLQRKQKWRIRVAHFREIAVIEDLDLSEKRRPDLGQVLHLV